MPVNTPIERLIEFIVQRRKVLGLTQRQLADAAKINSGTLANIEVGRVTKAPSYETQRALEIGLKLKRGTLQRVLDGENVDEQATQGAGLRLAVEQEAWHAFDDAFKGANPPTDEERRIANEAFELGITSASLRMPDFWQWPPEERRRTFRNLENLIEEERRNLERMKQHG